MPSAEKLHACLPQEQQPTLRREFAGLHRAISRHHLVRCAPIAGWLPYRKKYMRMVGGTKIDGQSHLSKLHKEGIKHDIDGFSMLFQQAR